MVFFGIHMDKKSVEFVNVYPDLFIKVISVLCWQGLAYTFDTGRWNLMPFYIALPNKEIEIDTTLHRLCKNWCSKLYICIFYFNFLSTHV